ncbi:MAG: RuBisCO large subunit C-terminal-like domain-containing protein [Acetanaerobacterium sp.]
MLDYFNYPYSRVEGLPHGWLTATYLVASTDYSLVLKRCGNFAVGQTVGTWVKVPGISDDMIRHRQGRVVGLDVVPSEVPHQAPSFILRLAFPTINFAGSLAMMLTALIGNDVSTALPVRLCDITYPNPHEDGFQGPRQGMNELRKLAAVHSQRPLVLNMLKPCAGFSPAEGARLFYDVAIGGIDLIKDDELLASPCYNKVAERTALYLKAAQSASEVCGKNPVYLPNITGTPKEMRNNAKAVLDAGAHACLINFVFGGLDALKEIADEFGDKLFIMGHYAGVSAFGQPYGSIANSVMLGLLPRYAGAHAVMTMNPNYNDPSTLYDFYRTVQSQRLEIPGLAAVVTTVGGGITQLNQEIVQEHLGPDIVIGIGGAIQGHPMGTTAGARAAMAAVAASANHVPLAEAALECPPLAEALKHWEH